MIQRIAAATLAATFLAAPAMAQSTSTSTNGSSSSSNTTVSTAIPTKSKIGVSGSMWLINDTSDRDLETVTNISWLNLDYKLNAEGDKFRARAYFNSASGADGLSFEGATMPELAFMYYDKNVAKFGNVDFWTLTRLYIPVSKATTTSDIQVVDTNTNQVVGTKTFANERYRLRLYGIFSAKHNATLSSSVTIFPELYYYNGRSEFENGATMMRNFAEYRLDAKVAKSITPFVTAGFYSIHRNGGRVISKEDDGSASASNALVNDEQAYLDVGVNTDIGPINAEIYVEQQRSLRRPGADFEAFAAAETVYSLLLSASL